MGDNVQPVDNFMVAGDPHIFEARADGDGSPVNTTPAAIGFMVWFPGLFWLCEAAF